jgi:hypothetical protein
MKLVPSLDVRPIGISSYLNHLDFDHDSLAVLSFFPPLDPRLVLVVLLLMFELDFDFSG